MTNPRKTMDEPVHLEMPLTPPVPAPQCQVCLRAERDRAVAREQGDPSAMTDANVVIRRHPNHRLGAAR
ncbi:hypothetical protein [Streptomyces sp. NPDC048188]|uniref:hypothetical protein n=1 Tax=Streptomyces sp. NPDC048188 TaxID=3155749 RepID=UPI003449C894